MSSTTPCKSLAIITGASRGIGRAIALALTDVVVKDSSDCRLPAPIRMVLVARSEASLQETARLVEQRCGSDELVRTVCHPNDLSDLDALPDTLQQLLAALAEEKYDSCWLFNNAGSLGPLGAASSIAEKSSMKELRSAIDFNVTSACWVSAQFASTYLSALNPPLVRIVNISSLCALEPFLNMGIYCAGKAGRELFHSVLAKENKDEDQFKVLNYAPGAADTPMAAELSDFAASGGIKKDAPSSDQVGLIKPEDTAKKLVRILTDDKYESGAHVDYWDD